MDPPDESDWRTDYEGGNRVVRWTVDTANGPVEVRHNFPDAVRHHYHPTEVGEALPLYAGPFQLGDDRNPFTGVVYWRWTNPPRVEAHGARPTTLASLEAMIADKDTSLWADHDTLVLPGFDAVLPPQPSGLPIVPSMGNEIRARIEQQVGQEDDLEELTFLIPNGWQALDGSGVCDPNDPKRIWHGRVAASDSDWEVVIDPSGEMDQAAWRRLRDAGGHGFTHIGRLRRRDHSTFSGASAFAVLDRVRVALNIALGRRTTCALPVGWRAGDPVWVRWRSAPVDRYALASHCLDESIAAQQLTSILQAALEFTVEPSAWAALRPAAAYYVASNMDVDVELSVAIPVSALQLLAYYRFVTERNVLSETKWKALSTETQLRLLLVDIGVDLSIQGHFTHLSDAQGRLAKTSPLKDALGVVMKMRNVATHPTKEKPEQFTVYEWAEAGMHARYWLNLALLFVIGYSADVAAVMGPRPRWTGQVRPPPWVSTSCS